MKILDSYKKIAKEFIKESAWDRKFGEPLPTLEDVMKEAESMQLQPKGGGKTVVFKNKDNYEKAKKSGDYEEPEETDDGGEKEDPSGKLGSGDFDRGSADSDSETGKDYVSKFQGTDEPEGGEADDYGVKAGSMADDEEAKQAVQGALQGQASDIEKLKDLGYEAMVDLIQSDEDFDTKVKSYVHAMGESTETSKIHILRETYERIGGK